MLNLDQLNTNTSEWDPLRSPTTARERLNTEENFLLPMFGQHTTVNHGDSPTQPKPDLSPPNHNDKNTSDLSSWTKLKDWLFCGLLKKRKKVAKVSPEVFGILNGLTGGEVKQAFKQRAIRNWNRARYLLRAIRITGAFSRAIQDRDHKIAEGKSIREIRKTKRSRNWLEKLKNWYISPYSKSYIAWKYFFQIMSIWFIFVLPYIIAFKIHNSVWNTALNIADMFYLFDIILHFFVAIKNDFTGDLILNKKTIAKAYLNGTFIADIIAIIPYDFLNPEIEMLKLIRIVRLVSVLRFIDQLSSKFTYIFAAPAKAYQVSRFLSNLLSLLIIFIVACHFGACFWISIGFPNEPQESTWLTSAKTFGNSLILNEVEDGSPGVYIWSFYHIVLTLTTVGYGEFTIKTLREQMLCMVFAFFGIVVFAFTRQQFRYSVSQLEKVKESVRAEIGQIEIWLLTMLRWIYDTRGAINRYLMKEVKAVLEYTNTNDQMRLFGNNNFFKSLPPNDKLVISKVSFAPLREQFSTFFNQISEEFTFDLLMNAEAKIFCANEVIIQRGKRPLGVYFIVEGGVVLIGRSYENAFRILGPGSFFGELLIARDKSSSISYMAMSRTKCIVINKELFKEVSKKYPKELKKLRALALYRHKYFLYDKANQEKGLESKDVRVYFAEVAGERAARRKSQTISKNFMISNLKAFKEDFVMAERGSKPRPKPKGVTVMPKSSAPPKEEGKLEIVESEIELGSSGDSMSETESLSGESDLQSSDICPIETFDMNFEDPEASEQVLEYLKDRIEYSNKKLETLKRKATITLQAITKVMSYKANDFADQDD